MALTVRQIEAARPEAKARKLFDGGGLYLEIYPNGSKLWRLKYRVGGRERRISFGAYPEVSLKEARERRDEARRLLRDGVDPSAHRQATQRAEAGEGSFEALAWEWWATWKADKAESTIDTVKRSLEKDILPRLGRLRTAEIEPPDILPVLLAIEGRGATETAHRVRYRLGMIFRYGVAKGRCTRDPTADLRGALPAAVEEHHAAITDPEDFGALLRAIDGLTGYPATIIAAKLAPLLFVRPVELRKAEWSELDLEGATWTIPGAKMKRRRDHVVPLARQAVALFAQAKKHRRGGRYVFPSIRTVERPMSENTINAALRRAGYTGDEATGHGFRASFRTIGDERLGFRIDLIEHQLAHNVRDPLGRAYNRTAFLAQRREMMQRWADWCDQIKQPSAARSSGAARPPRSA